MFFIIILERTVMRKNTLEKKLLPAPDFSNYDGGDHFIFEKKYYRKCGEKIGNGVYGEVFCFQADDHTKLAVKSELIFDFNFIFGNDFQKEAAWYQKIYGLGVFSGDPNNQHTSHFILMPYFEGKTLYTFRY